MLKTYSSPASDVRVKGNTTAEIAAANTAAAASGSIVRFPPGAWSFSYSAVIPPNNVLWEFDGPMINRGQLGGGTTVNYRKATFGVLAGNHPTTRTSLVNYTAIAEGSTKNGITFGDVGHEIRVDKLNWTNPNLAIAGEIDGQFIHCRQGGPITGEKSALGGQVIDVGMTNGTGFLVHYEHVSTVFDQDNSLSILYQIDTQAGALNSRDGDYYGYILQAMAGSMDAAFYVKNANASTGRWNYILLNSVDNLTNFEISDVGKILWRPDNTGNNRYSIENEAGKLTIKRSNGSVVMTMDQNGRVGMPGLPTASAGLAAGDLWVDTGAGNVLKRV